MRKFGVGRQTAVRILNQLVDEGLIVRRRGSGNYLSPTGSRTTGRIGLIVHGSDYCELFAPVARRISHLCQRKGLALLFVDLSGDTVKRRVDKVVGAAREFVKTGVDGVIFQ